jgi:choline dehydrogenase-like flavoprotein
MICDLESDILPDAIEADTCIVGAGPAGIAVALTLARRNFDVVLLESGGETIEPKIQELCRSEVVGRSHIGIHSGRARAFGGTSKLWGGQILPLFPIDFERRTWIRFSGWPIRLEDLEPYFVKALSMEGLENCLSDDDAVWKTLKLRSPNYGPELESFLTRWCPQPDFSLLYGSEIKRLPNLRCVLHATVTALETDGRLIKSAYAKTLTGKCLLVRSRQIIFCVGGIETPRLLLQPLKDGTPPPWAESGRVLGRFFQDHPGATCADILPLRRGVVPQLFDHIYHRRFKYQPRVGLSAAGQSTLQSTNAGGSVIARTKHTELLNQAKTAGRLILQGVPSTGNLTAAVSGAIKGAPLFARGAWRYFVRRRAFNPDDLGFRLGVQIEQPPRLDSRVSLSEQVDALGIPRAKLDWRLDRIEVDTIAAFAEAVKRAFEKQEIANVHLDADVASRSTDVLLRVVDQNHHMGTARMAQSSNDGVVDKNLKIFHIENAFICSSAVFPTSSFSNPTHTLIAMAVRLGDHIMSTRNQS